MEAVEPTLPTLLLDDLVLQFHTRGSEIVVGEHFLLILQRERVHHGSSVNVCDQCDKPAIPGTLQIQITQHMVVQEEKSGQAKGDHEDVGS